MKRYFKPDEKEEDQVGKRQKGGLYVRVECPPELQALVDVQTSECFSDPSQAEFMMFDVNSSV